MKAKVRKPKSAVELAASVGSAVAVAAFQRSGAGKHGGSARQRNRRERRASRRAGRDWRADW